MQKEKRKASSSANGVSEEWFVERNFKVPKENCVSVWELKWDHEWFCHEVQF